MTLSSRALAFSVDNLLKSTSYTTKYNSPDEDAFKQSASNEHMLAYVKDSNLSAINKLARGRVVDKKGEFLEEECSLKSTKCSGAVSNRNIQCVLATDNIVVQNKVSSNEHAKDTIKDEPVTVVEDYSSMQAKATDAQRHLGKETKSCSITFPAIPERHRQPTSPRRSQFRATGAATSSCFCHGEVTFCQHPGIMSVLDSAGSSKSIIVKLCHADLWSSFHALGTEMIITKSGRRMFPALKVKFCGLDPDKLYSVRLEFLQPDSRKYRYIYHSSRWMVSGSGDIIKTQQCHKAAEEPISGQMICSQIVSFERLKLTNAEPNKLGQVSLVSMQKFQPQLVVEEVREADTSDSSQSERYVITFPQTSFMAVTAYQNHRITTLKIASNPFAKGFRESGKDRIPYESLVHPVSIFRKAEQDYLQRILSPAVLPELFPRHGSTTTLGQKRNNEEMDLVSCTVPKRLKHMDNIPQTTANQTNTTKNNAAVHSFQYSELHSPLIMPVPSYSHPIRHNHQQQLMQELQHGQQSLSPSVSLYLQSVLHHSTYNSNILAQLASTALHDTTRQMTPLASRTVQPSSAQVSFQPIPIPTSNQPSVSPLIATIPSHSAAVLPFPRISSVKMNDNAASAFEHDLRSFPMLYCSENQIDQLSLVQQSRIRTLNTPMFSGSPAERQSTESSVRLGPSDSSSPSPGAFMPLRCMTDQVKVVEAKCCTGCDYHDLGKVYELVPGVTSLDCCHPR